MRFYSLPALALCVALTSTAPMTVWAQTVEIRTLDDALRIAEANSPRIRAADARREGATGDRMQAGAWPNPELFVDAENFAGSKEYRGTNNIELTAGLSQRIEIGGKRQARIDAAEAGLTLAAHDRTADQLALRDDVAKAYINALYAARLVALEDDRLKNAQSLAGAIRERVQNGRESPVQSRKTDITLAAAQVASQKAQRELQGNRAALTALLGVSNVALAVNSGWFDRIGDVPDVSPDEAALAENPDFARLNATIAQARAGVDRERAANVPDPTLRAGMRRYNEDGGNALVVGLSIPIPVFDQNSGNILRARQDLNRAEAEADAMRLTLLGNLVRARQTLLAAHSEAEAMGKTIIPAADEAAAAAREGYSAGKFGFLDLLDAQRTQFDVKAQHATALRDYHLARIELMRLVGRTY